MSSEVGEDRWGLTRDRLTLGVRLACDQAIHEFESGRIDVVEMERRIDLALQIRAGCADD